ncbi:MAG: sugar kinase [Anaerolineales bacterium]|nr:sugar kinase [Anaerolineales bacterium]
MTSKLDVSTTGEIMLRLSVPAGRRLETAAQFDVNPGGAEANVVALLARLGWRTSWAGALPASPLGRLVAGSLRSAGVAVDNVVWSATGRMGVYFVEFAASPRPTQVLYDRANSCAAQLTPAQMAWGDLLDTRLLHLTGITPALSASCAEVVLEALDRAHRAGVPVSFDVNYRQALWEPSQAAAVILPMLQGIDLLFCAKRDASQLFACVGRPETMLRDLAGLTQAKTVVLTLGDEGVIAWNGEEYMRAPAVPVESVDRLGAGDALAAGVMHGWLQDDLQKGLRAGVALAALALSQYGDMVVTTAGELESLLADSKSAVLR